MAEDLLRVHAAAARRESRDCHGGRDSMQGAERRAPDASNRRPPVHKGTPVDAARRDEARPILCGRPAN